MFYFWGGFSYPGIDLLDDVRLVHQHCKGAFRLQVDMDSWTNRRGPFVQPSNKETSEEANCLPSS